MNREPPLLFRVIRPPLVLLRFVLNSGYALLFSWWLDKRLVDSGRNREFAADIRKHLPFLFEQYGARILPNDREPPPSFDFALVTVVADDIVLRFFRDRGTVTVRASSTSAPDDSHELTTLLNVVDAAIKRRWFLSFARRRACAAAQIDTHPQKGVFGRPLCLCERTALGGIRNMTKLLDGSGRERLTEGFRKSADARKGFTLLELIVAAT